MGLHQVEPADHRQPESRRRTGRRDRLERRGVSEQHDCGRPALLLVPEPRRIRHAEGQRTGDCRAGRPLLRTGVLLGALDSHCRRLCFDQHRHLRRWPVPVAGHQQQALCLLYPQCDGGRENDLQRRVAPQRPGPRHRSLRHGCQRRAANYRRDLHPRRPREPHVGELDAARGLL